MSVNLYILTNPRPRRRTTHNGLSTRDSIVDNRISAKRGKNVAALIFETLRNHAAHPTACGLDGFNLLNRSRPYPDHDQTFARGSAKAADLGVQPPWVGSHLGDEPASRWLLARSKERADDTKALTISEGNC
jgi:hypothetical protein